MTRSQIDFERFNPFRTPDWRFERVLQMVDRFPNPGRSTRRDDEYIKGLRQFILRYRNSDEIGRRRLINENPGLYFAWIIHERAEEDFETMTMIECRILAGQPDEEICDDAHTIPEAIHWYERLFFNVRDRLGAHDWILKHVLVPAIRRSREAAEARAGDGPVRVPLAEPMFDATLRWFAYFSGRHVFDAMLSGFRRGMFVASQDGVSDYLVNHSFTNFKLRTSQSAGYFEVNKYNVMELFQTLLRVVEIERSADTAEQAQNLIHVNIGAMLKGLPWAVGDEGEKNFAGTPVAAADREASELRDDELLLLSSGQSAPKVKDAAGLMLPAPTSREGTSDADD
jgi:hypothetical protein